MLQQENVGDSMQKEILIYSLFVTKMIYACVKLTEAITINWIIIMKYF